MRTAGHAYDRPKASLAKDFTKGEFNVHILIQTATELAWHVENSEEIVTDLPVGATADQECT